jgi:hypothetical protein
LRNEKEGERLHAYVSKEVNTALKDIRDKSDSIIGINDLRKAYASSWLNDPKLSKNEKEKRAFDMGTSLDTLTTNYLQLELV